MAAEQRCGLDTVSELAVANECGTLLHENAGATELLVAIATIYHPEPESAHECVKSHMIFRSGVIASGEAEHRVAMQHRRRAQHPASESKASEPTVIDLDEAASTRRYRSLGRMLEDGRGGSTLYTRFLIKNGRRPDPDEATVIGELMGCRVRASDRNFYPPLAKTRR